MNIDATFWVAVSFLIFVGVVFSYARELVHYISFDIDKKKYNFFKKSN